MEEIFQITEIPELIDNDTDTICHVVINIKKYINKFIKSLIMKQFITHSMTANTFKVNGSIMESL